MTAVTFFAKSLSQRLSGRAMAGFVCLASQAVYHASQNTNSSSVFFPLTAELSARRYDGIIVMDSFGIIRGNRHWTQYIAEILYVVYQKTNMHCLAVVCGGASFGKGSYIDMLSVICNVFKKPEVMVWISMGNDVYPVQDPISDISSLCLSIQDFMKLAHDWVPEQRLVFGCSSSTWGWHAHFNATVCHLYDQRCAIVSRAIMNNGFSSITGSGIFEGVILTDRIGHVHADSMPVLSSGFHTLVKWGMAKGSTSKL